MIVTRNWLQEWIDISGISSDDLQTTLNSIGLEIGSYEKVEIPSKVVVGYVKSKVKHEDSDHLNVCEVDVGSEVLQIVCGAKNVATGQFVAVSLIGATLPNGITIKKSKLRGVESSGMICSATELGLPKISDGILVLESSIGELVIGRELREYKLLNDEIFEVELTPNRGDCLSVYGIARDLSAALDLDLKEITYDEKENLLGIGRIFAIHSLTNKDFALQYRAFDVKSKIPPLDVLKSLRLGFAGSLKSSNIDNLLTYVTYSTGVLMRAYDFKKICQDCEKITFEVKEEKEYYGVYAGDTELSLIGISQADFFRANDETKTVLVEANYTDPKRISIAVGENKDLKGDDHVYRSSRGSEPNLGLGENFLFNIISSMNGLNLYAGYQQILPNKEKNIVSFSVAEIVKMIGKDIDKNLIVKILKKLGFDINVQGELINASVPFFRHDIENSNDICEEIVRIININNIASLPLKFCETNRLNSTYNSYINKKNIRIKSASNGFYECIHYAFDSGEQLSKLGFTTCKKEILNPINNELNVLRPTLLNHMIKSCEGNLKNSKKSVKLFELGSIFDKNGNESTSLAFLACGLIGEPSLLNGPKPKNVDFLYFADLIQNIIGKFECQIPSSKIAFLSEFEQADIIQNGNKIGVIGRLDLNVESDFDLLKTYVCEIEFDKLSFDRKIVKEYSKMPAVTRDITLLIPDSLRYYKIKKVISSLNINILKEFSPIDIYKDPDVNLQKSLTIKLIFQDTERTLEDSDISVVIEQILKALKTELNIGLK